MADTVKLTTGRELRREFEEGVVIRLPDSGALVRVRSVQPDVLLDLARIPEILVPVIANLMDTGSFTAQIDQLQGLQQWRELVNVITRAALVSPRVVDKPAEQLADDEIRIEHLKWFDRVFLVGAIHRPLDELARFREEQAVDVEPVGNAAGDAPTGKPDSES